MEKYKTELDKLNIRQRQAVESIEGPVLVIAGPGTGKTQLLSTRAAYILRNTQAGAHNILCLTFTESAAFNMKKRMVEIIGESAYKISTSTYHSFGSDLLQRFPEYFGDIIGSKPIDDLLQYNLLEQIVGSLDYDNPLKSSAFYIKNLASTISDLKKALIGPKRLKEIATDNQHFIQQINPIIREKLKKVVRMAPSAVSSFEELLNEVKISKSKQKNIQVKSLKNLFSEELVDALNQVEGKNVKSLTAWKDKWLDKDELGQFRIKDTRTNDKLFALSDIYQQYVDLLESHKFYDYDDMILFAIEGLEINSDFRYTLQEQYQYVMLDEFQDTNAAQMRLVELLTDNPIYEKKPNILAVGDDNQAIYAFQGADYSNIVKFNQLYDEIKTIYLTDNYRSHQQILSSAQKMSDQIVSGLNKEDIDRKLIAKSDIKKPLVARYEFKTDIAHYAWVAKKITSLINSGHPAKEIAVIAPKHNLIEPLVAYLKKADVPIYYEKKENILDDEYISQIIQSARLVDTLARYDRLNVDRLWSQVLSYDHWRIPLYKLWDISEKAYRANKGWGGIIRNDPLTKKAYSFFTGLATISNSQSLETMLDYLSGTKGLKTKTNSKQEIKSPFYEYYFSDISSKSSQTSFWNLLSNLTVLRAKIRDRQSNQSSVLKLDDFIDFVQMHKTADIKVVNTSPYHEQDDSVQLMTAFAAKGLEFNSVFILAAIDEAWGPKARSQTNKIPLTKNLEQIRYGGADDDERLRLLYVAMTRAKQNLIIASYESNYANKPASRIRYFNERTEGERVISPILPDGQNYIQKIETSAPGVEDLKHYWASRHIEAISNAKLKDLLKVKLDQYQLSPTHLNSFTDIINGGPEYFYLNTLLRFPSVSTPSSIYGDVIHKCLQWVHEQFLKTKSLPSNEQLIKEFTNQLANKPLGEQELEQLKKKGQTALTKYYQLAKNEFNKADKHEFNFRSEGVILGEARLTGKIDKLTIDKTNRQIKVVDYKTGKSYSKWGGNVKLHNYKQQLYFYKLLVEGSYTFEGYKVSDACLDFIEAEDNASRILDLELDDKEKERIVRLIKAVWARIQKLDFPDITKYPKTPAGVRQFEDYLIKNSS